MFTGIIQTLGTLVQVQKASGGLRVYLDPGGLRLRKGDSVAVDGVCLTVEEETLWGLQLFLSEETLRVTKFGKVLEAGYKVNLEPPLRLQDPLGGHLVQGHVDRVGTIRRLEPQGEGMILEVAIPPEDRGFLVYKGSIAVDGISLTVAGLDEEGFSVAIIPYTFDHTTLQYKKPGDLVNIEYDIIGKYVRQLLGPYLPQEGGGGIG